MISGVVAAFLSWAGFEACASMGEETDDPGRNIPRALAGTLILTGVLFVVVMFAQVDRIRHRRRPGSTRSRAPETRWATWAVPTSVSGSAC